MSYMDLCMASRSAFSFNCWIIQGSACNTRSAPMHACKSTRLTYIDASVPLFFQLLEGLLHSDLDGALIGSFDLLSLSDLLLRHLGQISTKKTRRWCTAYPCSAPILIIDGPPHGQIEVVVRGRRTEGRFWEIHALVIKRVVRSQRQGRGRSVERTTGGLAIGFALSVCSAVSRSDGKHKRI